MFSWQLKYNPQTLFTWSGGPRSSGVGFFCFGDLDNNCLFSYNWYPSATDCYIFIFAVWISVSRL